MLAPNPTFAHTQRTHPNNIIYLSLVIRGWMKTLVIRNDFDFRFLGFRVLIWGRFRFLRISGFKVFLDFSVLFVFLFYFRFWKVTKTPALRRDLSMSKDMRDPMRANVGFAANTFSPFDSLDVGVFVQLYIYYLNIYNSIYI